MTAAADGIPSFTFQRKKKGLGISCELSTIHMKYRLISRKKQQQKNKTKQKQKQKKKKKKKKRKKREKTRKNQQNFVCYNIAWCSECSELQMCISAFLALKRVEEGEGKRDRAGLGEGGGAVGQ